MGIIGRRRRQAAFTLLELGVATSLLGVVGMAASASLVATTGVQQVTRETILASEALERVVEEMRAQPREEVFQRFNATADDDPAAGASPGRAFDVPGLAPVVGDADGRVGRIDFPGDGVALLEEVEDRELGMPRDLDGDGAISDADDHAGDHVVLPVRVRVTFLGRNGPRTLSLVTTL